MKTKVEDEMTIEACIKKMTSREKTIEAVRSLIEFHVEEALLGNIFVKTWYTS